MLFLCTGLLLWSRAKEETYTPSVFLSDFLDKSTCQRENIFSITIKNEKICLQ